tara:strand:+ start:634 stop:1386 length:753 start_codon:yes stop_codon:yes gene_type:complete
MIIRFFTPVIVLTIIFSSSVFASKKATEYEIKLGRSVAAIILGKDKQSTDNKLIKYVNLVGQTIVATSGRKDINYYFTIIESDQPNAIAAPGGYVFITSGLMKMIKNEAELAGVLAHEIAHINEKHVFSKIYKEDDEGGDILSSFLTAKNTSMTVAFNEISNQALVMVLEKGLDEEDEFEADLAAVLYLQNTGYKSQAYIDLISRLPHKHTHSKTHPDIKDRINSITSIYPKDSFNQGKLLEDRYINEAK